MSAPRPSRAPAVGLALLAATVAATTACETDGFYTNIETMSLATQAARAETWESSEQEPVMLTMDVPASVKQGTVAPIRVRVHNGTPRPLAIGFGRSQGFDVLVAQIGVRADSGAIWSPLKMKSTSRDATVTDPLRPGRDTTFEVQWPTTDDLGHSVPPGRYRVRAMVSAELLRTRQIWSDWKPIEVTP
jgi:hypothetical protein